MTVDGFRPLGGAFALLLVCGCARDPHGPVCEAVQRAGPAERSEEPEEVLRRFITAVLERDEHGIRASASPEPNLHVLWEPSGGGRRSEPDADPSQFARTMALRRARLREVLPIPTPDGVRELHVTEHEVNDGRVLILEPRNPVPFTLVKTDGRWRVDVGGLIAGRLAVMESRVRRGV